jgi:hypothetical protein
MMPTGEDTAMQWRPSIHKILPTAVLDSYEDQPQSKGRKAEV